MPIRNGPSRTIATLLFLVASALHLGLIRSSPAADAPPAAQGAVPAELQDAIRALQSDDDAVRAAKYELIRQKGDVRLVPALTAFSNGLLQDLDGRLIIYGDHVTLPDGQNAFPMLDAFTLEQLKNPDGSKRFLIKNKTPDSDTPGMMSAPYREQTQVLPDLISSLSLLDPDDEKRITAITDAGDKANPAFYSSDWGQSMMFRLDLDVALLEGQVNKNSSPPLVSSCKAALAAIAATKQAYASQTAAGKRFSFDVAPLSSALAAVKKAAADEKDGTAAQVLGGIMKPVDDYTFALDNQRKALEDIQKVRPILALHLSHETSSKFKRYLNESIARIDLVIGKPQDKIAAANTLAGIATTRAEGSLEHAVENAVLDKQPDVESALRAALSKVESYQSKVRFAENTFAGLSSASILILLALGLSIIFGLMGVINMAHGEFMMVGAFAGWGVSEWFRTHMPGAFEYNLIVAIPAAFLASATIGWVCEVLVVKHLYGRPLDTLLATWGIGQILIWAARNKFGDNMHVTSPHWLQGGLEVAPDLVFARNRLFIIAYCVCCVAFVYFIVNRTKLGLLLRATTQSRQTAMSLGVATRRVDAFTFAVGAGLAGLAGVAVTMVDKINPQMGQDYVVDSFMVVVVGGVGKLAGAILAGLGLGVISKYLEPGLGAIKALASGASVLTKVVVLCAIIAFLQRRPQGMFPPKGRLSDA